jgi:hypothetical protein
MQAVRPLIISLVVCLLAPAATIFEAQARKPGKPEPASQTAAANAHPGTAPAGNSTGGANSSTPAAAGSKQTTIGRAATSSSTAAEPPAAKCTVVLFFDEGCKAACQAVRPIIKQCVEHYDDKLRYVELDISEGPAFKQSQKTAKELGGGVFSILKDAPGNVPIVAIFGNPQKHPSCELDGAKSREVYQEAIEKFLNRSKP